MKKRIKKRFWIITIIIAGLIILSYQQNNSIVLTHKEVQSNRIPNSFNDYKIVQISDLHSKEFGKHQKPLVNMISKAQPDLIVVTGDTVDAEKYNEEPCLDLLSQIIIIAPVYLVTGNHEAWSHKFDEFENKLNDVGITTLRNKSEFVSIGDSKILLSGVDDPALHPNNSLMLPEDLINNQSTYYSILLSHRPELFEAYALNKVDLVFSGHAHGGQFRLPFIGGIIAPDQGLFPQYTSGIYRMDESVMVVSRGLGNSIIPQRIFNRPEVVLVTLISSKK